MTHSYTIEVKTKAGKAFVKSLVDRQNALDEETQRNATAFKKEILAQREKEALNKKP